MRKITLLFTALVLGNLALVNLACNTQESEKSDNTPLPGSYDNILSGAPVQKSPYPLTSSSFTDCGYNGSLYLVKQDILPTTLQKKRERLGPCLGEGTSFLCNDTLKTSCPGGSNRKRCITEEYEGQWNYQWYERFIGLPVDYTYLDDFGTVCGMSDSLKKQFDNTFPGPTPTGTSTVNPEPTPFCRRPCPTPRPSIIPTPSVTPTILPTPIVIPNPSPTCTPCPPCQ